MSYGGFGKALKSLAAVGGGGSHRRMAGNGRGAAAAMTMPWHKAAACRMKKRRKGAEASQQQHHVPRRNGIWRQSANYWYHLRAAGVTQISTHHHAKNVRSQNISRRRLVKSQAKAIAAA